MTKWHHAATLAGNPDGRTHYDIGGDDNSNIALVYPSEDGDENTRRKARLIASAPELLEFAEQIFNALIMTSTTDEMLVNILVQGRKVLDKVNVHTYRSRANHERT